MACNVASQGVAGAVFISAKDTLSLESYGDFRRGYLWGPLSVAEILRWSVLKINLNNSQ